MTRGVDAADRPASEAPPQRPSTALVHDWLTGMRGGEKVLERIARLFPEAPIYTLLHVPGKLSEAIERHPIRTSFIQRLPAAERWYRHYLPLFPRAIESFDLSAFDLVVSTSHAVAKGAIPSPGATHVCYCHTPMRYAWDQETIYFPKRTGIVAGLRGRALARLRRWDVATADRVHHYVANSTFVAERIRRYYERDATVIAPPVDTDFYTPGGSRDGRYAVMVSALAPYKQVDLAIAACERAGIELRIVGDGPERQRLEALGSAGARFHGRVNEEELRDLYRGALCFLQPGVEDFGISTVEALACGTPIVAFDRGGVRDIVETGKQGILCGEGDAATVAIGELAAAIDKIGRISFNKLNLRERAESFSVQSFDQRFQSLLSNIRAASPEPRASGDML